MLQKNALTALAYVLVGWLALMLAIPPGFASPLYPSAGLALAAVLSWGGGVLPGVALGSFAANMLVHLAHGDLSLARSLVCASIGCGAALQAVTAAALVRRFCAQPFVLDTPREVLCFFLVAGPLACVVSAGWAAASLRLGDVVSLQQIPFTLWTWWAGDTLGVLLGVPVALAFIGCPRAQWRPRRFTVALPLVVVTLVIGVAIALSARWENDRLARIFERDAEQVREQVRDGLDSYLASLEALYGLAMASDMESAAAFRRATAGWLQKVPSLQALGWSVAVPAGERAAFEERMRREQPLYRIFDRSEAAGEDAVVITFIEPAASNDSALGVNSLSIPAAREAIERAVRRQTPSASEGFLLAQDLAPGPPAEAAARSGVVVYRAVMDGGRLRGIVFVALRMENVLADLLSRLGGEEEGSLQACLLERRAQGLRLLAGAPACGRDPDTAGRDAGVSRYEKVLDFAGQEWTLRVLATPAYVTGRQSWAVWSFSALGLLTTGMLGGFLLLFTGRTLRIEEAVRQRTAELRREMGQRQTAQQALQESERRFREIFETAPVGIAYADLQGRFRRVNPRLCEIAGCDAATLESLGLPDLIHPAERPAVTALLAELQLGRSARVQQRLRCRRCDGSDLWVQFTGSRLDLPGSGPSLVGIVEDITERLRREEAERAREVAESANRAKSEFLSRMSHELRTPLNAMLGFAQLLTLDRRQPLADEQRQWVRHIEDAGWHLLELIDEVLDLSRVETGSLRLVLRPVRLAPLVDETLALVLRQARERDIAIELLLDPGVPAVTGDATRIKQILTNLLSNAIKYNRPGGWVRLESRAGPGAQVLLRVSDTGPGLSEAQRARLFEPFNRLGREHSGTEGTGIGLVISLRLAQAMGGDLRCDPAGEREEGASFTLALPAA